MTEHDWEDQGWTHPEAECPDEETLAVTFKCRRCHVVAQFNHGLDEPDPRAAGECE